MKTKLTLSITEKRVLRIKAYGARHRKSVSQLVEDFIDSLEKEVSATGGKAQQANPMDPFAGMLTGKITEADLKADPRSAHIYRKGL